MILKNADLLTGVDKFVDKWLFLQLFFVMLFLTIAVVKKVRTAGQYF